MRGIIGGTFDPETLVILETAFVSSPRPLGGLAQDEEPGGGAAGGRGGLGAVSAGAGTLSAAEHKTSALRSPAIASSMIVLAIISSVRSPRRLTAARAISNAMPTR